MSTNVYAQLRALLPAPPLLLAKVIAINADDTSDVELPLGLGNATVAAGVAVGTKLRVRGSSVPVDSNAFIRSGVIESKAPDGTAVEAVLGEVAALPFGPDRLSFNGPAVAPAATVGVAYTRDLSGFWLGGYAPRTYTAVGSMPAGLALDASTGVIAGTPTAAGARTMAVSVEDSTHRVVSSTTFTITVE